MPEKAARHARNEGFAKANTMIVAAAGIPFHTVGNTNNIHVIQV